MRIQYLKKATAKVAGFTLIEAITGAMVMGVVFVSLYAGMASGFHSIRAARENLRATQILQEKFETLRLYNWDQINATNYIPATFTNSYAPNEALSGTIYYGRVTISSNVPVFEVYREDMRLVTIELTWESGGTQRSRTFSTFASRYGLQHYIY